MSGLPTLVIEAPDWAVWAAETGLKGPPLLWPVGNQSLAAHWLDHAVRGGFKRVVLHSPDRPSEVRAALEGGAYWSLELDVRPAPSAPDAARERADRMPGGRASTVTPRNAATLLEWWLELNRDWLATRDGASVTMDILREPGGWIGPRSVVAPGTRLAPPYWIGAGSVVGPGCTVGPNALIGPGCVLAGNVSASDCIVLEGSYVGASVELLGKALCGPTLVDIRRGVHTTLTDPFIASAMKARSAPAPLAERLLALLLILPGLVLQAFCGPVRRESVRMADGRTVQLAVGTRGPLLARRARWLGHVLSGAMHLVGPLPRERAPAGTHEELARLVASTPPGVFSLADVNGVHATGSDDEFSHALYQSAVPEAAAQVRSALPRLLLKSPPA